MLTRRLGRTGHHSSVAVLGGAAFWGTDPDVTASAFTAALDAGVNHLDVAPRYGRAQELLGPLVAPVRDRLFVACKTMRHDPAGVRAQLEESLTLLRCEQFDLYQMHAVTDLDELDARGAPWRRSWPHATKACAGSWGSPGTTSRLRPRSSRRCGATTSTP